MSTRRQFLVASALCCLSNALGAQNRPRMGLVHYCYGIRRRDPKSGLDDPCTFLEHARRVGAAGVQMALGMRDAAYVRRLRGMLNEHAMYLEGIIALPRERSELERFQQEVQTARECGALVLRTVLMQGRRYEVFDDAATFRKFVEHGRQSLMLASPIVERAQVKLAVENHKDLRAAELAELIRQINSPSIGVCLDTGNSIALLETPLETVEALAPLAFTTHIKDMGVEEYRDGFRLAEAPLGNGFVELPRLIGILRKARPEIRLNLEMLTRDPLLIPCLTRRYWATLEDLHARRLADMLALVRTHAAPQPLPRISELTPARQIEIEDDNVRRSLRFAGERL